MHQSGNPTKKYPKKTSSEVYWSPKKGKTHFRVHPVPQKGTDPWEGKTVKESLKNMLVWFKEVLHPPNRNAFLGYHFVTTSPTPTNNVLLVKIEGRFGIYHHLPVKGVSKQTPLLVNQPMGKTRLYTTPSKRQGTLFLTFKLCCKKRITRCLGARRSPTIPKWSGWCCWLTHMLHGAGIFTYMAGSFMG